MSRGMQGRIEVRRAGGESVITFLLCAEGALSEPLLYLSPYLKAHRTEYYDLLQRVRMEGVWEEWLAFFLSGVAATAEQATSTAQRILALFERDRQRIEALGRASASALRVHGYMRRHPMASAARLVRDLGLSAPTVNTALRRLESVGVVQEVTGRQWGRLYSYREYLGILSEGTEPLG